MISVVVPTVAGREDCLARCLEAYRETTPGVQLIVLRDRRSCGEAWIDGAHAATGDFLHFTADDLVPQAGWWEAAVDVVSGGGLPAAFVLGDLAAPASRVACPCYFAPVGEPPNVLVPFLSRAQFELGGWLAPIHYGSDDWVTFLAVKRGIPVVLTPGYRFLHTADPVGRLHDNRRVDVPALCRLMEAEWFLPPVYDAIASGLDPGWRAVAA